MVKYIRLRYKLFLLVLIFWFLLALNFRIETIVAGVIISIGVTMGSFNVLYDEEGYLYHPIKVRRMILYVGYLFKEIYRAAFLYVYNILFHHYEPVVFDLKLDVDDPVLVGIIANSITLTPGTISIDSDSEKYTITVLTIAPPGKSAEALEKEIKDKFERLLKGRGETL
ncbi:MAG: Na+/H+ antiporter subunit E [Bacillota bacterium]